MSATVDDAGVGLGPTPASRDSRRVRFIGMMFAGAICLTYVLVNPASQDFASGHFRAQLASRGVYLWNNLWFGGHPLPGFGVVSPVLGGLIGVVTVAVISVLVATWCFTLVIEHWRSTTAGLPDPVVGVVLFAFGCGANLWGGRLTFLPAVMFGALALLLLQRQRPWMLAGCAAMCGLSSPLGALSLLVIIVATWFARAAPRRLLAIAALATVVPIGTLIVLFPEGGWFPFTAGSLVLLTAAVVGAGWCGRAVPLVRWAVITYAVVVMCAFVVKSPLGGNVVRLGWLAAGPAAALTLGRHRRTVVPAIVAASLVWNAAYIPLAFMPADRTASDGYYDSLVSYLDTLPRPVRVEVVPTQTFAQADTFALRVDGIARGWETQLDRRLNPEFYTGRLDADTYHRWLLEHAVSIVALPLGSLRDVSLDEAAVIRSRPTYLREVWNNEDWQVYVVADASPLVDNDATVVDVQPDELTIDATRTGWTTLKFRFTDLYRVSEGAACIAPADGGWIRVFVEQPGRIRLTISLSIEALLGVEGEDEHCRAGNGGEGSNVVPQRPVGDVAMPNSCSARARRVDQCEGVVVWNVVGDREDDSRQIQPSADQEIRRVRVVASLDPQDPEADGRRGRSEQRGHEQRRGRGAVDRLHRGESFGVREPLECLHHEGRECEEDSADSRRSDSSGDCEDSKVAADHCAASGASDAFMRSIKQLLSERFHGGSANLAAEVGLSRASLACRFNALVGEPPMTFLTGWRLALAADLLREPDSTVTSVARRVGYNSPFTFSAAFKRLYGVSPKAHRERQSLSA